MMVVTHFLKREFETAFVHRFSHATMPLFNLFKNCAHYWLSCGLMMGYVTYIPGNWSHVNMGVLYFSILLYTVCVSSLFLLFIFIFLFYFCFYFYILFYFYFYLFRFFTSDVYYNNIEQFQTKKKFSEVSNLLTHVNLATLRPVGSTERRIPYGYGFNLVSCPNYFFEILAWAAVTLIIPNIFCIFSSFSFPFFFLFRSLHFSS